MSATDPLLLPLPLDIPWKRLCISRDMLDTAVCDHKFPPRWKSSITVFGYEPPAEHQPFDDTIISYIKVSCTITGYNPSQEIGPGTYDFTYDPITQKAKLKSVGDYYGCYGAILEVAIKPNAPEPNPDHYPYFIDFQPKKRELYELVTQTGTKLSRSLESVQVTKSGTTATGSEVVDNDTGIDWGTVGGVGGGIAGGALTGGSPIGVAVGSAVGSALGGLVGGDDSPKTINQAQQTNVLTTDKSSEKREEFSHTTQLAQMYHQLTGYHLGTNRALFFMLPRPHIVQADPTFVDGPRVLEGIQEFLLVVARPKSVDGLCIDAYLETAHLFYDTPSPRIENFAEGWEVTAVQFTPTVSLSATYTPPDGWEFDTDNPQALGGYAINYEYPPGSQVAVKLTGDNKAVVTLTVYGQSQKGAFGTTYYVYNPNIVSFDVDFLLRKIDTEPQDIPKTLYVLGRGVCCCDPLDLTTGDSVGQVALVHEAPLASDASIPPAGASGMSMAQANRLTDDIGRQFLRSVNDLNRYARGTVSFVESQFVANAAARRIDRPDHAENQPVQQIRGLDETVRRAIIARGPRLRRAGLLKMSLAELRERFGLSTEQVVHLRRATLWLEEPPPPPEQRWDPPQTWNAREMPSFVGLPLRDAIREIAAAGLRVGDVTQGDSEQPPNTVLEQTPPAVQTRIMGQQAVDLVISTGLSVHLPAVIGQPLTEALCSLRSAGLQSEPSLHFHESEDAESQVLDMSPPARTYVTPHATVTLAVSRRRRR
ncbi:PASTA domain-containing protein [Aggregatilinea lenta]|uniref:PASTA domain-containing protein n=1 Tax=Aggregatilinea lenta TaxID=913108 RepID=UPI0013C3534B|nr:PASTA domain-containing protein [Aggregatilinea lenta]